MKLNISIRMLTITLALTVTGPTLARAAEKPGIMLGEAVVVLLKNAGKRS